MNMMWQREREAYLSKPERDPRDDIGNIGGGFTSIAIGKERLLSISGSLASMLNDRIMSKGGWIVVILSKLRTQILRKNRETKGFRQNVTEQQS